MMGENKAYAHHTSTYEKLHATHAAGVMQLAKTSIDPKFIKSWLTC